MICTELGFYFFSMWHGKEIQSAAYSLRKKINLLWGCAKKLQQVFSSAYFDKIIATEADYHLYVK